MRIKTKILGVKAMVPSRIVNKVKIFKKKQTNNSNGYMHIATFARKQLKT